MRKVNVTGIDSAIYARLQSVQMSGADRRDAVNALARAEQIAGVILWLKGKLAEAGHAFLKPSLKH